MPFGGFKNNIAHIDLSAGTVENKAVSEEDAQKYIGARGLGVKYLFDNGPTVDAESPDNLLCVMTGPLTGTLASMSGRMAVVSKSPLTGTIVDSHVGGWTAAKLKWSGFDGLAINGKADKPVYLMIENNTVEIKDASDLWGKGVHDTLADLRSRHGDDIGMLAIGQAGENGVRFACLVNEDDRAAGRGGMGCVAGMKNLKAIVVKGVMAGMPQPADKERFDNGRKEALQTILESPVTKPNAGGLSIYGTNVLMNATNAIGALPAFNSRDTSYEHAEALSGETIRDTILTSEPTCHACPVACKKEVEIVDGEYKVKTESFEYETAWALGANCGNPDAASIAYMIALCNDLGMDTIELGNAFSAAMEAQEKGLINEDLNWGDHQKMVKLTNDIALRQGFGDTLAEGPARAAEKFGDAQLANVVKGQAIAAYDPRGLKGMGIGFATSNRGACHLRAYTPSSEMLGIPEKTDPIEWKGKGELCKLFQDLHAVSDSFDICKFNAFAEGAEEYVDQYAGMTGIDVTVDDLMLAGERIYNLERYYNQLNGFTRADDSLPKRFLNEPSTSPGSQGQVCELDDMLDEYYAARGWTSDGIVPEDKLKALGIV
jgi:aldehyde:ferredoxin oxidoreductase